MVCSVRSLAQPSIFWSSMGRPGIVLPTSHHAPPEARHNVLSPRPNILQYSLPDPPPLAALSTARSLKHHVPPTFWEERS